SLPHQYVREFVRQREKTARAYLLQRVDENQRVRAVCQGKSAAVFTWEFILDNDDALFFDLPSHSDVERAGILGFLLVPQSDGKVLTRSEREALNVRIRSGSELGQAGRTS